MCSWGPNRKQLDELNDYIKGRGGIPFDISLFRSAKSKGLKYLEDQLSKLPYKPLFLSGEGITKNPKILLLNEPILAEFNGGGFTKDGTNVSTHEVEQREEAHESRHRISILLFYAFLPFHSRSTSFAGLGFRSGGSRISVLGQMPSARKNFNKPPSESCDYLQTIGRSTTTSRRCWRRSEG